MAPESSPVTEGGRRIVFKSKAITDSSHGTPPMEREMGEYIRYGMVNLDKPSGPTSHEVVSWVKGILGIEKAGHGGTLDPKVTGVLPVALEEATKVAQALLSVDKEYVCIMRLHGSVGEARLKDVFREFTGEIVQRPPVRSAVKRQLRTKRIRKLELLEVLDNNVLFHVDCEAGTYIRKLCHDIGVVVGSGAHMVELRRTRSGIFAEDTSVTLHDLLDAYRFWKDDKNEEFLRQVIVPVETAFNELPRLIVRDSAVDAISHGAALAVPGVCGLDADMRRGDLIGIFTLKDEIVAIGEALMDTKDILIEETGIAAKPKRVIMKPGVYPRMWKHDE
ncbi:MAG: RNA-guided pseudouridylation complex pseudouridine synthase subunit Cbf5 [Candidatus Hydrothermarchaeaceae archaeon]